MKKLLLFISVFTLILSITVFAVSAETKSLLPTDVSKWKPVDAGGESAKAAIKDDATVVSGSVQSWPNVSYSMSADERITVPIKGYAIEYDFVIDKGQSNIVLYMKGDTPAADVSGKHFQFPECIDTPNKDAGSGDIKQGSYKGVITLEDMMKNAKFPTDCANSDNTITFSGLTIYTVSGAAVTVNKFQLVQADKSSTSSDSSSSASSASTSSSILTSESKTNSSSAASSAKSTPAASSKAGSVSDTASTAEETPDSTWYYIIGGVALVAIIVTVVVIVVKRKKK
jgi:hypothetical protein